MACAAPRGEKRVERYRPRSAERGIARPPALEPAAASRYGGSDPYRGADGIAGPDRLRRGGGPRSRGAGAGVVRARQAPDHRGRTRAAHPAPALAGAAPDPDHPRPTGLLARLL